MMTFKPLLMWLKEHVLELSQEASTYQGIVCICFGIRLITHDLYNPLDFFKDIGALIIIVGAINTMFKNSKNAIIKNILKAMNDGLKNAQTDITNEKP